MDKTKKLLRILYIIGYTLTAIMLVLTIIFRDYYYYGLIKNDFSTLSINIPLTCLCFIASTIFLILVITYDKRKLHKTNHKNATLNDTPPIKEKLKNSINISKNIIAKITYITLYTLSALLMLIDIILINIPIINALIIPLEITLVILSIIFLLIANTILKTARYNTLIGIIQNQNRDK